MGTLSPGRTPTQGTPAQECGCGVWGVGYGPMCLPVLELPARKWAIGLACERGLWKGLGMRNLSPEALAPPPVGFVTLARCSSPLGLFPHDLR